jgi:hypothetical protein
MEYSETNKRIVRLGQELVEQLSDEERGDTLSRWIAHYIAEQIELAERAGATQRKSAQENCFNSILRLWEHRRSIPNGVLPLNDFDPILRALQSLDPADPKPRYWAVYRPGGVTEDSPAIERIMRVVAALDVNARIAVELLLAEAVSLVVTPEARALLEKAVPYADWNDLTALKELIRRRDNLDENLASEAAVRARRAEQIDSLERFLSTCTAVLGELKRRHSDG